MLLKENGKLEQLNVSLKASKLNLKNNISCLILTNNIIQELVFTFIP